MHANEANGMVSDRAGTQAGPLEPELRSTCTVSVPTGVDSESGKSILAAPAPRTRDSPQLVQGLTWARQPPSQELRKCNAARDENAP